MSCGCTKIKNIIVGNANLYFGKKFEFTDVRIRKCQACEYGTWITAAEYTKWLRAHGIDVLKNIADLTVLPDLPAQNYKPGSKLFCRKCKCHIPAKARVSEENCPLNKW